MAGPQQKMREIEERLQTLEELVGGLLTDGDVSDEPVFEDDEEDVE